MEYLEHIEKLSSQKIKLNLNFIKMWLEESKNLLDRAIDDSNCHQWKKWRRDNTFPILPCIHKGYPCDIECDFIRFYKQLQDFVQTIRTEEFYKKQLDVYNKIKHNQNAVFEWIIDIENYGDELTLIYNEIDFGSETRKKYITFEIDKTELPNLWKFKEVFEKNYYSWDFNKYM